MENPVIVRNGFGSVDNIHTGYYRGPSYPTVIHENGYTRASVQLIPISFGWDKKISEQTFKELMAYSLDLTEIGDYLIYATSGNKYAFHKDDIQKYGFAHIWDESMDRMDGWLGMKPLIEYVKKPAKNGILIEGEEETTPYTEFSAMPDVKRFIKPYIVLDPKDVTRKGEININDVGKLFSQNENAEEIIRNFLFINYLKQRPHYDPESGDYTYIKESALNWVRSLFSKHIDKVREVKGIGSGDLSQIPAEAVTIYRAFLVLANDSSQKAWKEAEALNLRGREAQEYVAMRINSVLEHELIHFCEPDELSKRASETRAGSLQSEHYSKQAELRKGTIEGRIYSILSGIYAAYAKSAGTGKLSNSKLSKLETLAKEYEAEARASGLKEGEIGDYVEAQLRAYAEKEIGEGNESNSEKIAAKGDLEAKTAESSEDAQTEAKDSGPDGASSGESSE